MRTHPARRARRRGPDPLLHLRRHPRARLIVSISLLAAAALVAHRSIAAGAADRAAWGRSVEVLVASRDVAPGEALDGHTELAAVPAGLVPDGALRNAADGRVARAAIYRGEVVVAARVAPDGVTGLGARVPDGHRAVAVPVEPGGAPDLRAGDRVDLLVALDPATAPGPPGSALAESVPVVDVGEDAVTVAVERADAARVAVALAHGLVTLALVGGT